LHPLDSEREKLCFPATTYRLTGLRKFSIDGSRNCKKQFFVNGAEALRMFTTQHVKSTKTTFEQGYEIARIQIMMFLFCKKVLSG
jgi:hypothetical protein